MTFKRVVEDADPYVVFGYDVTHRRGSLREPASKRKLTFYITQKHFSMSKTYTHGAPLRIDANNILHRRAVPWCRRF